MSLHALHALHATKLVPELLQVGKLLSCFHVSQAAWAEGRLDKLSQQECPLEKPSVYHAT